MGDLTEAEIFDRMSDSLNKAIRLCRRLSTETMKGFVYDDLRKELKLIEGCCRQAAFWRSDGRWLPLGLCMAEAHARAGEWLRGVKDPTTGQRHKIPLGEQHPLFVKLAENLEMLLKVVGDLKTKRTGKLGPIYAKPRESGRRTGAPVAVALPPGMMRRRSGLIAPTEMAS
jgi:hypothetical protein